VTSLTRASLYVCIELTYRVDALLARAKRLMSGADALLARGGRRAAPRRPWWPFCQGDHERRRGRNAGKLQRALAGRAKDGRRQRPQRPLSLTDRVFPLVGHRSVLGLDRDTVESLRDALDDKVTVGTMSWKTARHAWNLFRTLCSDLANARRRELRVCDDDPASDVKPNLRGTNPRNSICTGQSFFVHLCDAIPRDWRFAMALALYTYGRDGEVPELDWRDVDLARRLDDHPSRDGVTGRAKSTKTGGTRRFFYRAEPTSHASRRAGSQSVRPRRDAPIVHAAIDLRRLASLPSSSAAWRERPWGKERLSLGIA
jgi:hypothetical protein